MKIKVVLYVLLALGTFVSAQDKTDAGYSLIRDISYVDDTEKDPYRLERCKMDVYYPEDVTGYTTVVWFHGGGLEGGNKSVPPELMNQGIAVVAVNYRLSPQAKNPAYIEDAAQAVAWVFKHIAEYGGDPERIFVSGHSAGGYLTLMVGLEKQYLGKYGVDADQLKGLIPVSGQTNTHYTIRKERGLPQNLPVVDQYAPLNQARKGLPPVLLITGDRHLEMTARYEENAHLYAILKSFGNENVKFYELQGFDHGTVVAPACKLLLEFMRK